MKNERLSSSRCRSDLADPDRRGFGDVEPMRVYLNTPMTDAKKIAAATRSKLAIIFLFRMPLR
jgi:hypothetical protein